MPTTAPFLPLQRGLLKTEQRLVSLESSIHRQVLDRNELENSLFEALTQENHGHKFAMQTKRQTLKSSTRKILVPRRLSKESRI